MTTDIIIAAASLLLGLIPAYYFYRKSIRLKEPIYSIKSNNLILDSTSKYGSLKISYKRRKVDNLTVSRVLFYNRGAETITNEDILTMNPPRIIVQEGNKILDASILQVNGAACNFQLPDAVLDQDHEIPILFDYIDQNQGAVYEIIHTGQSSEHLEVVGDIRGAKKMEMIVKRTSALRKLEQTLQRSRLGVIGMILGWISMLCLVVANIFYVAYPDEAYKFFTALPRYPDGMRSPLLITSLLLVLFIYMSIEYNRKDLFKDTSLPKGLEKLDEE